MRLDIAFRESDILPPAADDPVKDAVTVRHVDGGRVSVRPDGVIWSVPQRVSLGEFERAYRRGNKLFWLSSRYPTGCYVALIAEGL